MPALDRFDFWLFLTVWMVIAAVAGLGSAFQLN